MRILNAEPSLVSDLGKGPKIKKRESMVFDYRGGGGVGWPKQNPYSDLKKDLKL